MMLPNSPPAALPMPATTPATLPASAWVDANTPAHADYNLQPMAVRSLDHYVVPADEERERFHIR